MRRRALVAVLAALALLLGACEPEGGQPSTERRPGAPQAHTPPAGGGQQPAPVQGDPGAHNTDPGELDLHVEWISQNRKTPACEWSLNAPGRGHVCENMQPGVQEPGVVDYIGLWEYETMAKAGDVVWISAQGNIGNKSITCAYHWKGVYHELPSSGNRCGGTATLS